MWWALLSVYIYVRSSTAAITLDRQWTHRSNEPELPLKAPPPPPALLLFHPAGILRFACFLFLANNMGQLINIEILQLVGRAEIVMAGSTVHKLCIWENEQTFFKTRYRTAGSTNSYRIELTITIWENRHLCCSRFSHVFKGFQKAVLVHNGSCPCAWLFFFPLPTFRAGQKYKV